MSHFLKLGKKLIHQAKNGGQRKCYTQIQSWIIYFLLIWFISKRCDSNTSFWGSDWPNLYFNQFISWRKQNCHQFKLKFLKTISKTVNKTDQRMFSIISNARHGRKTVAEHKSPGLIIFTHNLHKIIHHNHSFIDL